MTETGKPGTPGFQTRGGTEFHWRAECHARGTRFQSREQRQQVLRAGGIEKLEVLEMEMEMEMCVGGRGLIEVDG